MKFKPSFNAKLVVHGLAAATSAAVPQCKSSIIADVTLSTFEDWLFLVTRHWLSKLTLRTVLGILASVLDLCWTMLSKQEPISSVHESRECGRCLSGSFGLEFVEPRAR